MERRQRVIQPPRDLRLVVFLRGVNVGGHRRFRPSDLATELRHLGCQSIGAAGTFVFHKRVPLTQLRAELKKRLPFDTAIAVCHGQNISDLVSNPPFPARKASDVVRFVSVLTNHRARVRPVTLPAAGKWLVRVLSREKAFLLGEYRRDMKTIGYLGKLDQLVGTPVTTRNWNTIAAIAKALAAN